MKSRIQSTMLACAALLCAGFASCTDDALIEASNNASGRSFELTVTQANPDSRLELGQDGLTTLWEPGDKLVLVDKTRTLAPIYLNCTLEAKASTATFMSESGVPAGNYYVIYNYNQNLAYGHKGFQSVDDINSHDDLVLWNELTIQEGVDQASISLNHLYAKMKVELRNYSSGNSYEIGMYSSKKGFPVYKQFTSAGLVDAEYGYDPNSMNYTYSYSYFPSSRRYHNIPFGTFEPEWSYDSAAETESYDYSKAEGLSALVLPADLSGEEIFFYVINGNTCYEFKKQGVELKAGTSYKVVLDFSDTDVTTSTLNSTYDNYSYRTVYQLTNAADWRHAAYRNCREYYSQQYLSNIGYEIAQNIDFEGEYFFPISAYSIAGGGHTLSNIGLDWSDEDNVGLVRYEWSGRDENRSLYNAMLWGCTTSISDLTLENVSFKGNNYVGAFGGFNVDASNCGVIGASTIQGQGNYVGGVVGFNNLINYASLKLEDVRIGQSCNVSGNSYVGGIVGRWATVQNSNLGNVSSVMLMESCKSEASVSATEDYVGGIWGKIGGDISLNYATSSILEFSMEDNTFSLLKCVNEGTVTGRHYVGGIGGDFSVTSYSYSTLDRVVLSQSCNTGNVNGDSKVGGILGSTMASTNICYSTGAINASTTDVGGIVGEMAMGNSQSRIANCYSLATISVGTNGNAGGIVGSSAMATITNCYYAADPGTYSFGGIVGYSGGSVSVSNCLTTLNSLGTNLGTHKERNWVEDNNNDGLPDYGEDTDGDGDSDNDDLYYIYNDYVTDSQSAVTSILDNLMVINGDNAYSSNYWDINVYPWYCVKFASFSADTDSPDFNDDTIQ